MTDENALGSIEHISVHRVGNKANEEGMVLSAEPLKLEWQLTEALQLYFKAPLRTEEYYRLYHESQLELNEVYTFVNAIFQNPETLHEQSVKLAKHLFECSTHPNIKGGEFYAVFFKHCLLNDELVDAVGLFKSESKDTFLKVNPSGDGFIVKTDQGVNINKLDKGCIIFNTNANDGYLVAVVDNTNRQVEARYWIDDFLQLRQLEDAYFHTQSVMAMAKGFITKELPVQFDVEKADQADLMNRSIKFFKEQESFNMNDFEAEVIIQPEVISQFQQYRHDYQQEREMYVPDAFDISPTAVKKKQGTFKSVIKLDKNFSIYVHGNRSMIERGEDPDGRQFYKLYFEEER
ncbi:MAG: nucleoid-associated protein [Flavobacteriales bacterium]|nr:nucleoid-associated protein [Flavobacteriales bacterium]